MDSDSYNGDSLFPIVASQSQLQDVARLRALMLPSLSMLIRYLNVSTRQDYLVKRIHGEEEGGRERRREREREKEGRRGLIISYKALSLNCTCTYRLIVTIKAVKGEGEWGKEKERGRLIFVI